MPKQSDELPSTLERSPKKAQEIWKATHDSAVKEYGDGRRAHMTAYASLKHSFEKVGDHWEQKSHKGPSDSHAVKTHDQSNGSQKTYGGVDVTKPKDALLDEAKKVGADVKDYMTKDEIASRIEKANDRATAKARK